MKKIFFSIVAIAAIAACTKSEVAYEQPAEIGFKAVAGNITKTAVDGEIYPTSLNMYVFAQTTDNGTAAANYISNGEFKHKTAVGETEVWGGVTPYYWPNTKNLHFAGYSKSGNVTSATVAYNCQTDVLTIGGYTPGTGTDNDLMFFPSTETDKAEGYDRYTDFVPVNMYHTCAWLSFYVKGDDVTGATGSTYKVTDLTITGIDATADLTCTGADVSWDDNDDADATAAVLASGAVALSTTAAMAETTPNSTVLIPQVPGSLNVTYTYTSPAGQTVSETVTGLSLKLTKDTEDAATATGPTSWEAGKHYIYTITIKANEILIAPTPVDWDDEDWFITVE
ncbi:MAG: fimbrillin family protein [Bacteroidales bacterium]|nr:fimbrillin family protein [Bacteroidales bacterium]